MIPRSIGAAAATWQCLQHVTTQVLIPTPSNTYHGSNLIEKCDDWWASRGD